MRSRFRVFAVPSLLAAAVVLHACSKADEGAQPAETQADVAVGVVVVRPHPFVETVGAIGTVTVRAAHTSTLSAPAAGRIADVMVAQGQTVAAGQVLVQLEQSPFRAAVASAEAALSAAQLAANRATRLADSGVVPRKDAEQATADLARARADAEQARRVEQLSTLHAPIHGVITRLSAPIGASVDPAQPLVEIADPSAVDVLLTVTPSEAGRIQPGARVELRAGQSESGEPLGIGTVADVSATVDSTARGVAVRVTAPTTRRQLRIGETIFGAVTVGVHSSALAVPLEALVPEGEGFKVFVIDSANLAHATRVTVGARTASLAEIRSGLVAGQRVATTGAYGLDDSVKVVPKAGKS